MANNSNIRYFQDVRKERFKSQNRKTITSEEQVKVEESVSSLFDSFDKAAEIDPELPYLYRQKHVEFLRHSIIHLSRAYECLDASRPWLCYWILHSLELLGARLSPEEASPVTQFLARCQSENGGFAGGPGQHPHLAATYAAVNALATIGTTEAFQVINRENLQRFLWSLRAEDGSFHMHEGGEADIRGVYCALSVARLTNVYTDELFAGSADWIISCQTYEGGFAGVPFMEAHGGYAFCGMAALFMLGKESGCNLQSLLRWLVNRQMRFEGGFQGRTNKLVDGCYSFWQGAAFPLLHQALSAQDTAVLNNERWLFLQEALQEYILICCQHPHGGLIDKPGKPQDIYHTCYVLSGLSLSQHGPGKSRPRIVGCLENELTPLHPLYNVSSDAARIAEEYFQQLGVPVIVRTTT